MGAQLPSARSQQQFVFRGSVEITGFYSRNWLSGLFIHPKRKAIRPWDMDNSQCMYVEGSGGSPTEVSIASTVSADLV